jgi:hypothetical protein
MSEKKSEIAYLCQRIELQEEAAIRGLYGPAIVASHESITARMERAAEHLLQLIEAGKHEEVFALMNTQAWGVEEGSENAGGDTASYDFGLFQPLILDFPLKELQVLYCFLLDVVRLDLPPLLDFVGCWSIASSDALLSTTMLVSLASAENLSSTVFLLATWS